MAEETCNVLTDGLETEVVISGAINDELVQISSPAIFRENGAVDFTPAGFAVSGLFFLKEERVGNGFLVTLRVTRSGNSVSDGFAFVVQDEGLNQPIGNAGPSLGIKEFNHYLAVGFDLCNEDNRNDCEEGNGNQRVFVEIKNNAEAPVVFESEGEDLLQGNELEVRIAYLQDLEQVLVFIGENEDLLQGNELEVRIAYLQDLEQVLVFIGENEDPVVTAENVNLINILSPPNEGQAEADDGLFAFLGVTASTATNDPGIYTLNEFTFQQMNSDFLLLNQEPQNVDFGAIATFQFNFVDTCGNALEAGFPVLDNDDTTGESIGLDASLVDEINDQLEPIRAVVSQGSVETGDQATITLLFQTTPNIQTTYRLELEVNGVFVQGAPIDSAIITEIPDAGGLSTLGLILLISLLSVLVIVVAVIVRGWYNYRKKLKEHAEDIEYGKTKQTIDNIDKEVEYQMNPMVAPLDKLKERLAKNEAVIAEMKAGQQNAIDSDYTVEQLQQENEKLREEMADLKRKQELEGAGNRMSSAFVRNVFGRRKKENRADFDQEGA